MNRPYIPTITPIFAAVARIVAIPIALMFVSGHDVSSERVRTTKIVVPSPPGGVNDTLARLLGDQISRAQGQAIVIENRSGAGGIIGAEAVSRAAPDGNTLLMTSPDILIPPHMRKPTSIY
jgi:tripartite-type tricarboxylate transporter receptor subunit TctC